jgi:hypothetical protein
MGTRGTFRGIKFLRREDYHSSPSFAEIKNAWSYTSISPYVYMAWCLIKHNDYFTFLVWKLNVVKFAGSTKGIRRAEPTRATLVERSDKLHSFYADVLDSNADQFPSLLAEKTFATSTRLLNYKPRGCGSVRIQFEPPD